MPLLLLAALMAVIALVMWWTFSSILSITLGQLLILAIVGGIGFAIGRAR